MFPSVNTTSYTVSPAWQCDQTDALTKVIDIPEGSDPWTVNLPLGATLTCKNTRGIFSIEQAGPSPCKAAQIDAIVGAVRCRDPNLKFVDLSRLAPNPDLLSLPNRHPNIQGWGLPLVEDSQSFPELSSQFFWLRFTDRLLVVKVENLPAECCLRVFTNECANTFPSIVNAETLPFGDSFSIWFETLFNPEAAENNSLEQVINKVRLLDYLGLDHYIPNYDDMFHNAICTFAQWLQVLELVNSLDKDLFPYTRYEVQQTARQFVKQALSEPRVPDWLKGFPLTKLWEIAAFEIVPCDLPCTQHAIDLVCSPESPRTIVSFIAPTCAAAAAYLLSKVKQHPSIDHICFRPPADEAWDGRDFTLVFAGVDRKFQLRANYDESIIPYLEFLPKPLTVVLNLWSDEVYTRPQFIEAIKKIKGIKVRGKTTPLYFKTTPLYFLDRWFDAKEKLAQLCSLDSALITLHPGHPAYECWREAVRTAPNPKKIHLMLDTDITMWHDPLPITGRDLDLPVKSLDLILQQDSLEFLYTNLNENQGSKIRRLVLRESQLEKIPFHLMPNLKELSLLITPEALPQLDRHLKKCPKLKSLVLSFKIKWVPEASSIVDADLKNLPLTPKKLHLVLPSFAKLTVDALCSAISDHPGYVEVSNKESIFRNKEDRSRIEAALRAQPRLVETAVSPPAKRRK